jgi:hypothetical protein
VHRAPSSPSSSKPRHDRAGPCQVARTGFHVLADLVLLAPRPSTPSPSPTTATTSDANECGLQCSSSSTFDLLAPDLAKMLEPASTCSQISPYSRSTPVDSVPLADDGYNQRRQRVWPPVLVLFHASTCSRRTLPSCSNRLPRARRSRPTRSTPVDSVPLADDGYNQRRQRVWPPVLVLFHLRPARAGPCQVARTGFHVLADLVPTRSTPVDSVPLADNGYNQRRQRVWPPVLVLFHASTCSRRTLPRCSNRLPRANRLQRARRSPPSRCTPVDSVSFVYATC